MCEVIWPDWLTGEVLQCSLGARHQGAHLGARKVKRRMSDLDKVVGAVLADRSLWVELECPDLSSMVPKEFEPYSPTVDPLHCTVVYVGKSRSEDYVRSLHDWLDLKMHRDFGLWKELLPMECRIGGISRFRGNQREGDPIVLLAQDTRIRKLRGEMLPYLGLKVDEWDYTPHITLGRVPQAEAYTVPDLTWLPWRVRFTGLALCAGEERVSWQ